MDKLEVTFKCLSGMVKALAGYESNDIPLEEHHEDSLYYTLWMTDTACFLQTGSPLFDNVIWVKKSEDSIRPEVKVAPKSLLACGCGGGDRDWNGGCPHCGDPAL